MKTSLRTLLLILCLTSFSTPCLAEFTAAGIQIGATGYMPRTSPDLKTSRYIGGALGVFFENTLDEIFSIVPEITYVQKGGKYIRNDGYQVIRKYEDAQLTALIRVYAFRSGAFKIFPFVGPGAAVNLDSEATTSEFGINRFTGNKQSTVGWNYFADGGIGFEYELDPTTFIDLTGRYSYGFMDSDKDTNQTWIHEGAIILAGVKFVL